MKKIVVLAALAAVLSGCYTSIPHDEVDEYAHPFGVETRYRKAQRRQFVERQRVVTPQPVVYYQPVYEAAPYKEVVTRTECARPYPVMIPCQHMVQPAPEKKQIIIVMPPQAQPQPQVQPVVEEVEIIYEPQKKCPCAKKCCKKK